MLFIFLHLFFIYNYHKTITFTRLSTNSSSSSVSPSSNATSNWHNSKVTFSEFDSLQLKTGDKVSSNIGNPMTLINNLPANILPIISDDMKKLLCNKKDSSTFFSLKNVSNTDRLTFIKNIFISGKPFVFPKKIDEEGDRPFQHSWLEIFPWLCYSLIKDGAYCMYSILFNGDSSGKKIQFVHTPFNTCSDTQCCLKGTLSQRLGFIVNQWTTIRSF